MITINRLGLLLLASSLSHATNFTYNATVTLDPANLGTYSGAVSYEQTITGAPTFTLQSGDTLTGTITFTNGSLSIVNPAGASPYWVLFDFTSSTNPSTDFSSSVDVLGLTGTLGASNPTPLVTSSSGQLVAGVFPNGAASNYSFDGVTYTINVLSVTAPNSSTQIPASFSLGRIDIVANQIGVGSATPEPASFALCGIGCIALALIRRRQISIAPLTKIEDHQL